MGSYAASCTPPMGVPSSVVCAWFQSGLLPSDCSFSKLPMVRWTWCPCFKCPFLGAPPPPWICMFFFGGGAHKNITHHGQSTALSGGGSWKLSGVKQTCNKGRKTVLQFSVHVVVWSVSFPQLKLDERCRRWCGFSQHQPGFQAAGVFYLLFFFITKPQTRLFKIIVRNPVIAHFQSHCGSFSSS